MEVTKAAGGVKYSNCAVDGSPLFVSLSHNKRGAGACPSGRSPTLAVPGTGRPGEPESAGWRIEGPGGEVNSRPDARHLRHRADGWRPGGDVSGPAAGVHSDERTGGGLYLMR